MSDNQKINDFFRRIEQHFEQTQTLPAELTNLIQQDKLKNIYGYFLCNRAHFEARLAKGQPFRLDKKRTNLARTLNVIFHPQTKEPILLLETKSKNALNQKDANSKVYSGAYKSTKVAWRIDSQTPEKVANAVFYINKIEKERAAKQTEVITHALSEAKKEVYLSDMVAKNTPNEQINVNCPVLGQVIDKPGIRKSTKINYVQKISFYSAWAQEGTLDTFLETEQAKALTPDRLNQMAKQLIKGLVAIHKSGVIHQDIKPANILVFNDGIGNYRLELADFGISASATDPNLSQIEALATVQYESPEISAANNKRKDPSQEDKMIIPYNHAYFYDTKYLSYGQNFGKEMAFKPEYSSPDKANDAWALGVVLHIIFNKTKPSLENQQHFSPLIAGLLQPDRANRFTVEQALECIEIEIQRVDADARAKAEVEALEREVQVQQAKAETTAFIMANNGFHPGFRANKSPEANPRKMSRCNLLYDWVNEKLHYKRARM